MPWYGVTTYVGLSSADPPPDMIAAFALGPIIATRWGVLVGLRGNIPPSFSLAPQKSRIPRPQAGSFGHFEGVLKVLSRIEVTKDSSNQKDLQTRRYYDYDE